MAKPAAKPAAKPGAKPTAEEEVVEAAPKKKGKKKLVIIIVLALVLLSVGAVALMMLLKPAPIQKDDNAGKKIAEEEMRKVDPTLKPTFADLGTFTANLVREESDRYLQVTIQLKLAKPELLEQIKLNAPEVQHRVNMLLQSKRPSDLYSVEGKEALANQIREQVEYVLGLRRTPPVIGSTQEGVPVQTVGRKNDISEVLFTTFIIQ